MKRAHFLVEAFSWAGWWRKRICLGHVWRCVSTEHSTTQLDDGTCGAQVVPIATPKNVIDSSRESNKLSTSTMINTAAFEVLKPHQLRANPETSLSCIPRKPSKSFFRYPPFLCVFLLRLFTRWEANLWCPVGCWSWYSKFSTTPVFRNLAHNEVTSIQIINCNSPRTLNIFRRRWLGGWVPSWAMRWNPGWFFAGKWVFMYRTVKPMTQI